MRRVLVIGLDAAAPSLVFNEFRDDLPNLSRIAEMGVYGRLRSCHPPITIPAWIVMVTGVDPGGLGLYGFRHRRNHSYTEITLPSSYSIRERRVWDYIGEAGGRVCLVGVPPTYPPQPVSGWLISCLMTPSTRKPYTYPLELKGEVEDLVGEYVVDVPFRRGDRENVLREIYDMTGKRFQVVKYLLARKPWDFFMFVEIGLDRVQHAFWKYFDKNHHLYESGNRFESVIRDYYRYLDREVGEILSLIGDAVVIVVSDHGAKRMKGAFCINEWLIREGYLKLKSGVEGVKELEKVKVNWSETVAWAWGGYYARVFINVKGREKYGVVNPEDYEDVRSELIKKIKSIRGPSGEAWSNHVYRPEELYPICRGNPPDLIVYFDDLYWRSAGTIGHDTFYLPENDLGPDDAVHDYDGVFIFYDPKREIHRRADVDILDITPTILKLMGLPIPSRLGGRVIEEVFNE